MSDDDAVGIESLNDKSVFFGLDDTQLGRIAALFRRRVYAPGEFLFPAGEPGDTLFIIESGEVELFCTRDNGKRVPLATVGAGALLGEMSLITVEPRSASGIAVQQTRVMMLKNKDLAGLLKEDKDLMVSMLLNITRLLSKRLRQADQRLH